jgi:regulator of RNase E activity RraB
MEATWPDDADGDVLRRLHESGFDFSATYDIDFNVDLKRWPPDAKLVNALKQTYKNVQLYEPEEDSSGYILVVVNAKVTYDLVMATQKRLSELAEPYGGICEAWGVLH